jgi:predicted site-specific integrase-resolvase
MKLLNNSEIFISIAETAEILGVCTTTIRRYEKSKKLLPHHRTLGGHRRYSLKIITKLTSNIVEEERKTILYSRVSSHDQKDDMKRQSARLLVAAEIDNSINIELIEDLGSGLNYKKRGLKKLIKMIISSEISTIYLTHKDRLLRFGSDLIINLAKEFGTKVKILEAEELTFEQELSHDVLEIITVFSAKLYGSRSHKNRKNKKQHN